MNQIHKPIILVLLFSLTTNEVIGQTCCTGGVPLLDAFSAPDIDKNKIGTHIGYNYNINKDLISEDELLSNSHISRSISTIFLQADYGLTDNISVSFTLPFLFQEESISQSNSTQKYSNNGIGDVTIWLNFSKKHPKLNLFGSIGMKMPTGSTDKESNNIPLPISLQTGSGSWDLVIATFSSWYLGREKKISIESQLSGKINSKGAKFEAHPNYKFGSQFQFFEGLSYHILIGTLVTDLYSGISYQYRSNDQFDGDFKNTNSGGHWVNFSLGSNIYFSPDFFITVNGGVPIYRKINGLQLSTTWQSRISISYIL